MLFRRALQRKVMMIGLHSADSEPAFHHSADVAPTLLETFSIPQFPQMQPGRCPQPLRGRGMALPSLLAAQPLQPRGTR